MSTCRFCGKYGHDMLKYGVRHYAHHACYLDAGKKLADLQPWQVQLFPAMLIIKRKLTAEADAACGTTHWSEFA